MILVTGGAGFIGSNFILDWLAQSDEPVVNLDKLTYAGNPDNLLSLRCDPRHVFIRDDICDTAQMTQLLAMHRPRAIVHFAAESHVDRSIHGPGDFIATNVNGTFSLLEAARAYRTGLAAGEQAGFRLLHVSTDEVYGSLGPDDAPFSETTAYAPNSPYAASKAAADHLVRAYHRTYGLPTLTTNCSNNYGPYQFPEKLIPLMIISALAGRPLPVYGDGRQIRDWLYVGDHCAALRRVLAGGRPGHTYNIGGCNEKTNLDVLHLLCDMLDKLAPADGGRGSRHRYRDQIVHVADRPGHDRRYAVDAGKIGCELDWKPAETFDTGILKTVQWYLEHRDWVEGVQSGDYRKWVEKNYTQRDHIEETMQ
jgi:dTDP-glucose 4,6-dehydratase